MPADLTDIFADCEGAEDKSRPEGTNTLDALLGTAPEPQVAPKPTNPVLAVIATRTVEAQDVAETTREAYEVERARVQAEIEQRLVHLREPMEKAQAELKAAKAELLETMVAQDVSEIVIPGRSPIVKKVTKGSKKSCTKTFLAKHFAVQEREIAMVKLGAETLTKAQVAAAKKRGKEAAEAVWGQLERNPDKSTLLVPSRPASHEI